MVKCVAKVVERALEQGSAHGRKSRLPCAERTYSANYTETEHETEFVLRHYDTPILACLWYDDNLKYISIGGAYSASDRNAINTALSILGLLHTWHARIVDYELNLYKDGEIYEHHEE